MVALAAWQVLTINKRVTYCYTGIYFVILTFYGIRLVIYLCIGACFDFKVIR